ncbi:hypothetical protein ID866_7871 [Astraeus odoratus]|nr:hypothetical protein ID866_7871 [Astraeus odoratus]
MLLQWCNLTPYGSSKLAAIRFASPCRVHSVKIFPTDARPFVAAPDVVARTEPKAFFMDVYFNAHPMQPVSQADGKSKSKAPNALIPTVIPYAGGQAEFVVNMGADARIPRCVRGDFETVSMAIYDPPSLNVVIRLMFCLKPPNEDWDLPEFPHLYSDLHEEDMDIDLDSAYRCLSRPVADDIPPESLQRFAEKIADAISTTDNTRSYFIAGILCRSASQHPDFVHVLMQTIDLERVFDASTLDEDTVLALLDASANPDIARLFDTDWFKNILHSTQTLPGAEPEFRKSVRRLMSRFEDWRIFGEALSNPDGDFISASMFMRDVGSEEKSFGIWLSCMIAHDDLLSSTQNAPTLDQNLSGPLWDSALTDISYAEFLSFVKAYVGVACVLAVYAWSDSLPNDHCRERTLGVLRLWQGVPGYREIVNHLLLLRQMTFRLECMTMDNDPPAMPGIHAENIILNLVNEPRCYLSPHFVKCIRSWQPFSLTYISEEERISLERAATVADDGLPGAIEELARTEPAPFNMDRVRALRVAVTIILHCIEEDDDGDWNVLQTGWKEDVYGLFFRTVDAAFEVGQDLRQHFSVAVPSLMSTGLLEQLLLLSQQLLLLLAHLEPFAVTTIRTTRSLVDAVLHIFMSADMTVQTFSTLPYVYAAGMHAKRACLHVLRIFSESSATDSSKTRSAFILRTLFQKSRIADNDPCQRVRQIFELATNLLPTPSADYSESSSKWVHSTLPVILDDIEHFLYILDVDRRCELVCKLITLDNGVLGFAEWFISQTVKHMSDLAKFVMEGQTEHVRVMTQQTVDWHIQTIMSLTGPSSTHSSLCLSALSSVPDGGLAMENVVMALLNARVYSDSLLQLARLLASSSIFVGPSLNLAVAFAFIRGASVPELHADVAEMFERARKLLSIIDGPELALDRLLWEFGHCLSAITDSIENLEPSDLRTIVSALIWLCDKLPGPSDIPGLSWDKWDKLCSIFEDQVALEVDNFSKTVKGKLTPLPDSSSPTTIIPDAISMSIHDVELLLQPTIPVPSTPKRKSLAQDVLGLVALSPPTALLRSPAISGLTKTYTKNDFRELRQTPSARQNTSRLPSMHVDVGPCYFEFEFNTSSPIIEPVVGHPIEAFGLGPPFSLAP